MTSVLFAIAFSMMAGLLFQAVENADMKAALLNQAEENASTQVELLTQTKVLLADAYLDRGIHLAEKGDVRRGMHWMVRALEMTEEVQRRDPTGAAHLAPIIRMNLASWGQCVASREISLVHTDWVWDVAFSPDQKVVVTGSRDKRVQTWHARTGQRLGPSLDHPHPVWGIAFHPNGTLFTLCGDVALGDAGLLTVWTPVADKPGHFTPRGDPAVFPYDLMRMCMSPAGDRIWISSRAGESVLYAFDPEGQGNGLRTVGTPPEGHHQLPAFSPDGAMYATIVSERPEFLAPPGFTKQVQLWDARTGNALGAPLELPGVVRTVLFSADGKHLIVGSATSLTMEHGETSLIQVWDLDRRKCVSKSHPLPGRIKASTLSHGGQLFAVSLFDYSRTKEPGRIHVTDGHIELWQVTANGDLESYGTSLRTHHVVWHMTFSPDDRMLLAGCENHGASLWSVSTCQRLLQPIWHEGNCVKVAFTKDGRTAVTASAGGGLHAAARLWEVPSFSHIGRPLSAPDGITAAYWENDGKHVWIASGFTQARWDPLRARKTDSFSTPNFVHRVHPTGDDRRVFVDIGNEGPLRALHHDTRQLKHLPHRFNHTERGFSYMYHPQKQLFLQCWAKPCKMQLRDSEGNPVSPVMNAADFEMTARELSPDASLLAVALTNMGHSNKLIVVRTRDMATLHDIPLKYEINALGFTPDGKHLAFGGKDRQVQRLNTETGKLLSAPLLHEGVVYWTSYLGGDRVLATSSEKGLILLWDAPTGKRIGPAFAHCADLSTIAVHPQGKYLLTAPTGKLAMTWRVPDSAEGPLERIRSWVETTTGMEMTENDTIVPLDMDTVMQKRQRLAADR
jgi:WD40 repeat protein